MNLTSSAARLDPLEADLIVSRVMDAVRDTPQERAPGWRVLAGAAAGLLVAVAALALAGGVLSPRLPGTVGAAGAAGTSVWTAPESVPGAGITLSHPSGWTVSTVPWPVGVTGGTVTFLGTVPATVTMTPAPNTTGGAVRVDTFATTLTPGAVVLRILVDDGTDSLGTFLADPTSATATQVGGRPAVMGPSVPLGRTGAEESTTWVVSSGDAYGRRIVITAVLAGPGLDALRAQVDAVVASITLTPSATPAGR
jgi:hypothetical protein